MALIARGTKSNGSTSLADGDDILAAELNADFDTAFDEINGGLDSTNIAAGGVTNVAVAAGIDAAKIDDYSATATEMRLETNPGVSGAESLATTLEGELARLRWIIKRNALGSLATHYDGSSNLATYWGDQTVRGPNLIRNGSFEVKTTGSTAAPDGWALFGASTPTTVTQVTTDVSNGTGKALQIVGDAAFEGIQQTLTGLKASTSYFFQCRYKVTTGTMRMATTGGISTGDFRNADVGYTSATWTTAAFIVNTNSTPDPVILSFRTNDAADDFLIDDVICMEMNRQINFGPNSITVRDSSDGTGLLSTVQAAFPVGDGLSAAVTVPGPGCEIQVRSRCCLRATATSPGMVAFLLYETPASTGTPAAVDIASVSCATNNAESIMVGYTNRSPTPGDTYTYTIEHDAQTAGADAIANGVVNGLTTLSWLEVTLHVPG